VVNEPLYADHLNIYHYPFQRRGYFPCQYLTDLSYILAIYTGTCEQASRLDLTFDVFSYVAFEVYLTLGH